MILHDLIDDTLGVLGILAEGQEASPEQCEFVIRKLNLMLAQWELDGIDLQWSPQTSEDLPSEAPIPSGSELAVIYYLAFAVAPHFKRPVPPEMAAAGASFYDSLVRRAVVDQIVAVRPSLPFGEGQFQNTSILTDS